MKFSVTQIVYIGLLSALTIIGTFINFILPLGSQGTLVHLGTAISVIAVLVFGKKVGTISSTLGMTLFDIFGGWFIWAPGTLIARLGFGYLLAKFALDKSNNVRSFYHQFLGLIIGGIFMVFIYYIWEVILYGNWIIALSSIPANVLQIAIAFVVGFPASSIFNKANKVDKY